MEQDSQNYKPINLREIIAKKNKRLSRQIPSYLINYLNKIIHVDDLNGILFRNKEFRGIEFIDHSLEDLNIKFNLTGTENIPVDNTKIIFASNHPLGGVDGLILISQISKLTRIPIKLLVNDFLMNVYPVADMFVPINKVGNQTRGTLSVIDQAYQSDSPMLIFPAGLCSRKINGHITDLKWNKHFIQKAIQYKRDIIPVYFDGRNSSFFYNLARIRKLLHLHFNIEMLYLPDEMFKHRNKTFNIIFGKPIPYSFFDRTKTMLRWAKYVKEIVYSLSPEVKK